MSQLKSNTEAFIETNQYGTRKPKKDLAKEKLKNAIGSFNSKLTKKKSKSRGA